MPRVDFFKEIPGISEAARRENDSRDAAFLDLETDICGFKIRQMTVEDHLVLSGLDNDVVQGRLPHPKALAFFLWYLSPGYRGNAPVRRWWFAVRVWRKSYDHLVAGCRDYMAKTMADAPSRSPNQRCFASGVAHAVNLIAINYGWKERDILKLSLRRMFQYQRCIQAYHNPRAVFISASDSLVGNYLRTLNQKKDVN